MIRRFLGSVIITLLGVMAGIVASSHGAEGEPYIVVQPSNLVVLPGEPALFAVQAQGVAPLQYQWRRDGVPIPGGTNQSYLLPASGQLDDGAVFSVLVSNPLGTVISSNAVLRVDPGVLTTNTVRLVAFTNLWRYNQSGVDLGTTWTNRTYNDSGSGWSGGLGVFDVKSSGARTTVAGEPVGTQLSLGPQPAVNNISVYYFRTRFTFVPTNQASVTLRARAIIDDGAALYLNGQQLFRAGLADGALGSDWANRTVGDPVYEEFEGLPSASLISGENVLAAELHQVNATSSDATWGVELIADVVTRTRDTAAPIVEQLTPAAGATVDALSSLNVVFSEAVTGVDATDLLVNGFPASSVLMVSPREFQFNFGPPATGVVMFAWASGHGITDQALSLNPFGGGSWSVHYDPNAQRPQVLISEFMADNQNGLEDEDGTRGDWIELFNPGPLDAQLRGWFLTDDALNPTKWCFPDVVLGANRYLVVWATEKNRTNSGAPLHTNFRLEKNGEYLALLDARTNVVSAFSPLYPLQEVDISYGRDRVDPGLTGYFTTPTPGAQNATTGTGFAAPPAFSHESGVYTNNSLTVTLSARSGTIRYTLNGSVPTASSPVYTGPLTFSTNVIIKARVFDSGVWPSEVVARTYVFLDSSTAEFNSNLPIMIISTMGRAVSQNVPPGGARTPGILVVSAPSGGRTWLKAPAEFSGLGEFEIFGQTSAGFPKKPYNIEIQDALGNDRAVSLLGMPAEADWKLRNPYSDKCMMNDFLGYELFEQMGHYQVRRRFVEVFVDTSGGKVTYPGDYHGILVLLERIEAGKDRVDIAELTSGHTNEPAISGGYIFKKDKDSTGDVGFSTTGGAGFSAQALKIHEPKPTQITTAQLNWLRNHLNQFERALYAADWITATGTNHYSHYIDVDSFVDMHWIVEFTKQIDGYRLSSYFTKDRNGKIKWEPIWDWNLSFGNADYADGWNTPNWYYHQINENQHIWLRRLLCGTTSSTGTSGDPVFNQRIIDRWSVLRTNVFNATNVLRRVDELAGYLAEAAARDFAKFPRLGTDIWPNPDMYAVPTTYSGIITNMKNWILGRYLWIDSLYPTPPVLSHAGGQVAPGFALTMTWPASSTAYYTLDGSDPRLPTGGISPLAQSYLGPIVVNRNVRCFARALRNGVWSGPSVATLFTAAPALRMTEIMYHPWASPTTTNDAGDFEFVELTNVGSNAVNLLGIQLVNGIQYTFSTLSGVTNLGPGGRVLLVRNATAFVSRYPGLGNLVAGEFSGSLDNAGERLTLLGPLMEPIQEVFYDNAWYWPSDGRGFSLVPVDERSSGNSWTNQSHWRLSATDGGSPGAADSPPVTTPVVLLNEVMSHPIPPYADYIELLNTNTVDVDVGGWYLTDNSDLPKKYRIPPNTIIRAGETLVFWATNAFGASNIASSPFGLGAEGDDVWLWAGDGAGNLTGYFHGHDFGPAAAGVPFGRHVISTGREHFVAQQVVTPGGLNSGPLVGPLVISEFMYQPPDLYVNGHRTDNVRDEFIEIRNITDEDVPLFDPSRPVNTWSLAGAVNYRFPTNAILHGRGALVVVGFDPVSDAAALTAFRARYSLSNDVTIVGPFEGRLGNSGERIELRRPGLPNPYTGSAPMILTDRVDYEPTPPWEAAAGTGASMQRLNTDSYGNDPANWTAAGPTPGKERLPGDPPAIVRPPQSVTAVEETSAAFTVEVTGTGPFTYQWYWNGQPLDGAYGPTLLIPMVELADAGSYVVYILGPSGAAISPEATLTVLPVPVITRQPVGTNVAAGGSFELRVSATGAGPLRYQWQLDEVSIAGATNDIHSVTNASLNHSGVYRVLITDMVGTRTSQSALVNVLVRPTILSQPAPLVVATGATATFMVEASGQMPLWYRWRRNNTTLLWPGTAALTLSNVALTNAGAYDVVITNLSSLLLGGQSLSTRTPLVVVAPPVSQTVAEGTNLILRALLAGPNSFTNRYAWVYNGTNLLQTGTNVAPAAFTVFTNELVLTNFSAAEAGTYTFLYSNALVITNTVIIADPPNPVVTNYLVTTNLLMPVAAFNAEIRIGGADSDGDQLPDQWEILFGLDPYDPIDGSLDSDLDGLDNLQEYLAGTSPRDPGSSLRLRVLEAHPDQGVLLEFAAASNRTYVIEYLQNLWLNQWSNLMLIPSSLTNRTVQITDDPAPHNERYYRVRTPAP